MLKWRGGRQRMRRGLKGRKRKGRRRRKRKRRLGRGGGANLKQLKDNERPKSDTL